MGSTKSIHFLTNLQEFSKYKFEAKEFSSQEGEVVLQIDSFAFTGNNISYAFLGDSFGYWKFFPSQEEDYGIIPVWGFASVISSKNPSVAEGERFYGYYPSGSHLLVQPGKVRPNGFADTMPHRSKLPGIYNFYTNLATDPMYTPESENFQLIYRPLFSTSFLLEDFLYDKQYFASQRILLTSASSKTAIALAYLIKKRKQQENTDVQILGMTSEKNLAFVKDLGLYDEILGYTEISHLQKQKTTIVDFAGNQELNRKLEEQLDETLQYLCLVGIVHGSSQNDTSNSGRGKIFFAPAQMKKRSREWGLSKLQETLVLSYQGFASSTKEWLKFQEILGQEAFAKAYQAVLTGSSSADTGVVVKLSNS
ncbi:MAG: DUF2855 family protein [Spirochaetota bacterium]